MSAHQTASPFNAHQPRGANGTLTFSALSLRSAGTIAEGLPAA